jgi:hypothetical protein
VKGSVCVLLFLFKGTLHRPYCQFELRLARAYGVPVISLLEGEHYRTETYSSVLDLQSAFDRGELPVDLKPILDKTDFDFFYRRQHHEHAAMISRLCEKLEAATATGPWPAFSQVPDPSGEAVCAAYRMLGEELHAGAARPTTAPSVPQAPPPNADDQPARSPPGPTAAPSVPQAPPPNADDEPARAPSASLAGQLLALSAAAGGVLVGVRELSKLVSEASTIVKHTLKNAREIKDTLSPVVAPIFAATHRMAGEEV